MKLKLLSVMAFLMISLLTYGQKYVVTPNGLRDSSDIEKTYLVIICEGKTAKELYDNAIKYIQQNYKNPQEVIKGQIEAEYLSFDTYVSGNYKCGFSVNRNASVSASLITDFQRNIILKNFIFKDSFSVFQPVRFAG